MKIYLALACREFEEKLKQSSGKLEKVLNEPVQFVGETSYKEGVLQGVKDFNPDVIILTESLKGNIDISQLLLELRTTYQNLRIILVCKDRKPGDAFLNRAVTCGIYDLLIGSPISGYDLLKSIVIPNTFADVAKYVEVSNIGSFEPINHDNHKNTSMQKNNIENTSKINKLNSIDNTEKFISNEDKPVKPIENIKTVDKEIKKEIKETTKEEAKANTDEEIIIDDDINDEEIVIDENDEIIIDESSEDEIIIDEGSNDEIIIDEDIVEEAPVEKKEEVIINESKPIVKEDIDKRPITPITEINQDNQDKGELVIKEQKALKIKSIEAKTTHNRHKPNSEKPKGLFNKIFSKNENSITVNKQVISFLNSKAGNGNSQLSFISALNLSEMGYKVIYIDLNRDFSSIDSLFQLGYSDVGLDTALEGIKNENYALIKRSIVSSEKLLMETNEESFLYSTYKKLPKNLDYLIFSGNYMKDRYDISELEMYLKDLNMYLMMQEGYDFIIINTRCDLKDKLNELALIYASKIFVTITQDMSSIYNHTNQINILKNKSINYKEKFYYLLNKYENSNFTLNKVYELLSELIDCESFNIVQIPNINKEFINSSYEGVPISWVCKNKEFNKAMSNIQRLILN